MDSSKELTRDRRIGLRKKVKKEIKLAFRIGDLDKTCDAVLEEINESGMSLHLNEETDLPRKVKIQLTLPSSEQCVIPSVVRWKKHVDVGMYVGVSFALNALQTKSLSLFMKNVEIAGLVGNRRNEDRRAEVRELRQNADANTNLVQFLKRKIKQRVAITGIGAVTPMGLGWQILWEKVSKGISAVSKVELDLVDGMKFSSLAAKMEAFDTAKYLNVKKSRKLQKSSQFACIASNLAIQDSGIKIHSKQNANGGVFLGTIIGGMERIFEQSQISISQGIQAMNPLIGVSGSWDEATSEISMLFRLNGPSHTICTGCASSTDAIGLGFRAIQNGEIDFAIAGGSDAPISTQITNSYQNLGLLARNAVRPFDLNREGFVLGEGATFLILEQFEKAKLRGARIYAELVGYGNSCDAYHATARDPLGSGLSTAILNAIRDADVQVNDIDYVNLHGTATQEGDRSEVSALRLAFRQSIDRPFYSCIKPMVGHMQGACGSTEAATTILAMQNQFLPPLINLNSPDPECELNFVKKGMSHEIKVALSLNSGFGGKNAVLIYRL